MAQRKSVVNVAMPHFLRQIIAEKRDLADGRGGLHESLVVAQANWPMLTILMMHYATAFTKNQFQALRQVRR